MLTTQSKAKLPSAEELKKTLPAAVYAVTQEAATEPPFSGKYLYLRDQGTYHCVVCRQALFRSEAKFDSHCGWPSFFEPMDGRISYRSDSSHHMIRTEIRCSQCLAHLGHVFDDGPAPTGKRYCLNSLALLFQKGMGKEEGGKSSSGGHHP